MITRWFCILSLCLFGAGIALGDGTYQRTKEGKTIVWNDAPKPGDTASWAGDRDGDGYATGIGMLTWYTARGAVYARFQGNMVRGKFSGMVNGYSQRKSGHALFVAGHRTTRWASGAIRVSKLAETQVPAAETEEKETESGSLENQTASVTPERIAPRQISHERKESVTEKLLNKAASEEDREKTRPTVTTIEPNPLPENFAPNVETAPEAPNQALTKPIGNEIAAQDTVTPPAAPPEESPARDESNNVEPEAPAEGPRVEVTEGAAIAASPSSARDQVIEEKPAAPEEVAANAPATGEKPIEPDGSMPPATLSDPKSEIAASSQTKPRLTNEEVILLANTQLLEKGYNRLHYVRQQPHFDAGHGAWSVAYDPMTFDGVETGGPRLNVVIDDRTKGTVFLLRK